MSIGIDEIPSILEEAYAVRKDMCLCLMGDPGIGKTQAIYQFAEKIGVDVVEIIASQILPNEVSGITMPVNETHSMEIYDHARLSRLKDGDILFFDELLQAAPQTLSACLTLIQERRMMSGKLLPDVMIVAAANPVNSPASIPLSIRQRFQFLDVKWKAPRWQAWVKDQYGFRPDQQIVKYIRTKGDGWNTLTPRTVTKLIAWGTACKCSGPWERACDEISGEHMFTECLRNGILNIKRSGVEQIVDAIKGSVLMTEDMMEILEDATLGNISLKEMVEKLQALPEWPQIEAALSETEED